MFWYLILAFVHKDVTECRSLKSSKSSINIVPVCHIIVWCTVEMVIGYLVQILFTKCPLQLNVA